MEMYQLYLEKEGMKFKDGWPLFTKDMFLNEWADLVVPYDFRNSRVVNNPQRTVLCFYTPDKRIYPRLEKVLKEIPEYKRFMGCIATDVTVTEDMDDNWQDFIMLLNLLFLGVLAVNGVKVVPNFRYGTKLSQKNLMNIPKGILWSASFLGCRNDLPHDFVFISGILRVQTSGLMIYGKHDFCAEEKLKTCGIPFRCYSDYHTLCKRSRAIV